MKKLLVLLNQMILEVLKKRKKYVWTLLPGLLYTILLPTSGLAEEGQQPDPRLSYGGYTPRQVYQHEWATYRGMVQFYEGTYLEYPVMIEHFFDYNVEENQNQLIQTTYYPLMQYEDTQKYYAEALKIAEHINTYSGQPAGKEQDLLWWEQAQADIYLRYNLPIWHLQYQYHLGR